MASDLRCYRLNEYEWYSGRDAEEAIAAAMADSGCSREETVDDDFFGEADRSLVVRGDVGDPDTTVGEILDRMGRPGLVCGTEW